MIMNIGSQKAERNINNYSGGNIVIGAKKRIDDVGSVFVEVPQEELSEMKFEQSKFDKMEDVLKSIKEMVEGVEEQHSQNINLELALQQDNVLNEIYQAINEVI